MFSGEHFVLREESSKIGTVTRGMMDGEGEMAFGRKEHSREQQSRLKLSTQIPPRTLQHCTSDTAGPVIGRTAVCVSIHVSSHTAEHELSITTGEREGSYEVPKLPEMCRTYRLRSGINWEDKLALEQIRCGKQFVKKACFVKTVLGAVRWMLVYPGAETSISCINTDV